MPYAVMCYALRTPGAPVTEGVFDTLDAATAFVDARIARTPTKPFTDWRGNDWQRYRECDTYGFTVTECIGVTPTSSRSRSRRKPFRT